MEFDINKVGRKFSKYTEKLDKNQNREIAKLLQIG